MYNKVVLVVVFSAFYYASKVKFEIVETLPTSTYNITFRMLLCIALEYPSSGNYCNAAQTSMKVKCWTMSIMHDFYFEKKLKGFLDFH